MRHLYLIRHAQASYGAQNYDQLSPLGVKQSRALAEFMASLPLQVEQLHFGTLARQIDTASALIESGICRSSKREQEGIIQSDWLNELDSHSLVVAYLDAILSRRPELACEKLQQAGNDWVIPRENFQAMFKELVHHWHLDDGCTFESFQQFQNRVFSGIEGLLGASVSGEKIALVTSGGVIASICQKILKLDLDGMLSLALTLNNASITEIQIDEHGWQLVCFNNTLPLLVGGGEQLITQI